MSPFGHRIPAPAHPNTVGGVFAIRRLGVNKWFSPANHAWEPFLIPEDLLGFHDTQAILLRLLDKNPSAHLVELDLVPRY